MAPSEGPELAPEVQRCLLVLFSSELSTLEPPTKTAVSFCLLFLSLVCFDRLFWVCTCSDLDESVRSFSSSFASFGV